MAKTFAVGKEAKEWAEEELEIMTGLKNENKFYIDIQEALRKRGYERSIMALQSKIRQLTRKGRFDTIATINRPIKPLSLTFSKNIISKQFYDLLKETINEHRGNKPVIRLHASKEPKAHSLCWILSDLHIGKRVKVESNEIYNLKIAKIRMENLLKNFLDIYYSYVAKNHKIDEIVLFLVGDMVDNEIIYEQQVHNIDTNVVKQLLYAQKDIWKIIDTLSEINRKLNVRVICVKGNHGRVGNTIVSDDSNWDLGLYYELQFIFNDVLKKKNVSFEIAEDEYALCEVKGWKGLIRHEVPQETKTPSARAKFGGWFSNHLFDFVIGGHWHNCGFSKWNRRPVFFNGSLTGIDDLSEKMAVSSDPEQLVFGVSEIRKPSFLYVLDAEDPNKTREILLNQ